MFSDEMANYWNFNLSDWMKITLYNISGSFRRIIIRIQVSIVSIDGGSTEYFTEDPDVKHIQQTEF